MQTTNNPRGNTYPLAVRLRQPSEFRRALSGRRLSRGALLSLHTPKTPNPKQTTARLGIIVAKRFAKLAVTRNTIKRVIRAFFQQHRQQLPPIDLVFRLHQPIGKCSLTQLKQRLHQELNWHLLKITARHG